MLHRQQDYAHWPSSWHIKIYSYSKECFKYYFSICTRLKIRFGPVPECDIFGQMFSTLLTLSSTELNTELVSGHIKAQSTSLKYKPIKKHVEHVIIILTNWFSENKHAPWYAQNVPSLQKVIKVTFNEMTWYKHNTFTIPALSSSPTGPLNVWVSLRGANLIHYDTIQWLKLKFSKLTSFQRCRMICIKYFSEYHDVSNV